MGNGLTLILEAMPLKERQIVLFELDEADDCRLLAQAARWKNGKLRQAKRLRPARCEPAGSYKLKLYCPQK